MKKKAKALKAAFPHTIPILTGFMFLGMAYGIIMESKGYHAGWTTLFSLVTFAGSAQYVAITFLTASFNPTAALMMTLMVNARHVFYGISLLEKYQKAGKYKPYLIFGLCDETFSIVCSTKPPPGIDQTWFFLWITLLNHSYWVLGSLLGGLVGSLISFDLQGLDFVLTALFVVIFTNQWKSQDDHKPAICGVVCSTVCLIVFGPNRFLIPSMVIILLILSGWRRSYLEKYELVEEPIP